MMLSLLSFLFLSFSSTADVHFVSSQGQITAVQGNCAEVEEIQKDLQYFALELTGSKICDSTMNLSNNQCTLTLKKCLPSHMAPLLGKSPTVSGPNCYGTSLFATKNYKSLRFVSEKEFHNWVEFGYCVSSNSPQPGDIGAFQTSSVYVHAFTYLSENLVYEKMGFDTAGKTLPIIANLFANTRFKWEADEYCRRYSGESKECYNKIRYYKCDTGSFFAHLNKDLKTNIESLEKIIHQLVSFPNQENIVVAQDLIQEIEKQLLSPQMDEATFRIVREMLNSIDDQLESVQRHISR